MSYKDLAPAEAFSQLKNYHVIDIRDLDAGAAVLAGSRNIPLAEIEGIKLDKNTALLIYCQRGIRSLIAIEKLEQLGYTRLTNLAGGIDAWLTDDLPVTFWK